MIRRRNVWILLNRNKTKWLTRVKVNSALFSWFSPGKRDEVVIKVQKERTSGDKWWFYHEQVQDEILLTLHSPADAIIGQYGMEVLILSTDGHILQKTDKIGFHLLFNPWCKGKKTNKYTYTYIYSTILFINQNHQNQHCFLYKSFVCVRWWCPPPWWKSTAGVRSEWRWDCLHGRMVWHWPQVLELRTGTSLIWIFFFK